MARGVIAGDVAVSASWPRCRATWSLPDARAARTISTSWHLATRHTRAKKNRTDGVRSTADEVPLRYMVAFVYPITATMRQFLAKKERTPGEVDRIHDAWFKAVKLQVALWCQPDARQGSFWSNPRHCAPQGSSLARLLWGPR